MTWFDSVYKASDSKRVELVEDVLSDFAMLDKTAENLARSMADNKEFKKFIIPSHIHYVPATQKGIFRAEMTKPCVGAMHKRLPLLIIVHNPDSKMEIQDESFEEIQKEFPIAQSLSWAKTVSNLSSKDKEELFDLLVEGIRAHRKENKNPSGGKWLSDVIKSQSDFKLVGYSMNIPYLNVEKRHGNTRPLWIHPWGTPQMYLQHRKLPVTMIAGPSIRLDENVLGDKNMLGFTG